MSENIHISFGSLTDSGAVNEFNKDAVLEFKILDGHVFVVSDGHDGEQGHGALASKVVTESIKKYFYNRSYSDLSKALTNAITFANLSLYELIQKDSKYKGIASTIAILIYRNGKVYYAYAGDNRIYVMRDGKLQPLTRDHVKDTNNASDSEVTVLMGRSKDISFGVCKKPLDINIGDTFLICTDGLTDQLTEDEIYTILSDENMSPEHKASDLIKSANDKGGKDNVTVQVIEFSENVEPVKPKRSFNIKPVLTVAVALFIVGIVSFAGYKVFEYFSNKKAEAVATVPAPEVVAHSVNKSIDLETNVETAPLPVHETEKKQDKKTETNEVKTDKVKDQQEDIASEPVFYEHKVKFGENLYRLGIKYNIPQQKILELNGDKAKKLVAGTILKIPVTAVHTVKSGESYSVISDKYNVKIKLICTASGTDPNQPLKEGARLIIPLN